MGHNRDVLFLIFFREKAASAVRNRIVIGGQDFSITAERVTSAEQLSRTGYRSNAFVTFPFGKSQYAWPDSALTNPWRRTFRAIQGPDGQETFRSEVADGTKIEILTTSCFGVLVHGIAAVQKSGERIVIDWQHVSPAWAKGYHFQSIAQSTANGYDLEVRRTQADSAR